MESYLNELKVKYYDKFGEFPPILPIIMAEDADWFVSLLELSISTNEALKQEDVDEYIDKNGIQYDVVEEEKDGNKD